MNRIIVLAILILFSCARREALTGGEEDRIAPEITHSIPRSDSTRIGNFTSLEFTFSERIDRKSFEDHFYTIPFLKYQPTFLWDGWDKVVVTINDTLQENLTYLIKIGKGFKDLHSFPSDKEYQYAITKSEQLDSLTHKGRIYTKENLTQLKFALYSNLDLKGYPDYIVDVNKDNYFSFSYLKPGRYFPLFFNDGNNNHRPDIDKEKIALLTDSLQILKNTNASYFLTFFKPDTLPAAINKMDSIGINAARISFNKQIDLKKSVLFLSDTNKQKYIFNVIGDTHQKTIDVYHEKLPNTPYLLKYDKLVNQEGIESDTMTYDVYYKPSVGEDTLGFKLEKINISDSVEVNSLKPVINFTFSRNFVWDNRDTIQVLKNNTKLPIELYQRDLKNLQINFKGELNPSSQYNLSFSFKELKSLDGKFISDSTASIRFFTPKSQNFGSLIFSTKSDIDSLIVSIYSTKSRNKPIVTKKIKTKTEVIIPNLETGHYIMDFFHDLNNNKKLDQGQLKPFKFSEPMYFHSDTVYIRKSWDNKINTIDVRL